LGRKRLKQRRTDAHEEETPLKAGHSVENAALLLSEA
jgi:hypothetical protein